MTKDNRTEQDKSLEVEIFGYLDPFPPIPGSFKDEAIRLAKKARGLDAPDTIAIEPLRAAVGRMRQAQSAVIDTLTKIM